MVVKLSPQNISLYQNRWKLIHDFELAEANHRSLYDKLLQLSHLREAAQILGWDKKLKAENEKLKSDIELIKKHLGINSQTSN